MTNRRKENPSEKVTVLILGGGFAGYYALRELDRLVRDEPHVEAILVSRDNYVLFTPMLHEVAASDVDPNDIAIPLHMLVRRTQFFCGEAREIDLEHKTVMVTSGAEQRVRKFTYDYLLLAVGSTTNFHGLAGVAENAITMKSLEDAMYLRNHMVQELEKAEVDVLEGLAPQLTFVVCGGGFAGVETVGAMADFLQDATRYYAHLARNMIRVVLVHSGPELLKELASGLGRYATEKLRTRGVEVLLNARVLRYQNSAVHIRQNEAEITIETRTLVWTAGVGAGTLVQSLPVERVRGRLLTQRTLELPGWPGAYAVGDCAAVPKSESGRVFYGPTAQNALRQGRQAARNIAAAIRGRQQQPFVYQEVGQLATIGQRDAVAGIFGVRFSGFLAWWLWRTIYLAKLPRLQKKVQVGIAWLLDLFFSKNIIQYRLSRVLELYRANYVPRKFAGSEAAPEVESQAN